MKNDVVILIPSYEPDQKLIDVVRELKEQEFPVLVVNDGSNISFDPIFESVMDDIKYIRFPNNRGKGDALKEGYKNISKLFPEAKYVITADGDGQHATKDIVRMYELLKEHNELVLGIRELDKDAPIFSVIGNEMTKVTRCLLTKKYLRDDQCGLRGFPVRYIPELITIKGHRYDYEINQLTSFQLRDYEMITMPIEVIYFENNSKTHFRKFFDMFHIQCKIAFQGIPALACLLALIGVLLTLYGLGFSYHHLMIFPAYLGISLVYITSLSIIEPSNRPISRLLKELLFSIIKATFVFAASYLLIDAFRMSPFIAIPLLVVISTCLYNLLLPRVIV